MLVMSTSTDEFNKLIQAHIKENIWVNSMPLSKWTSWSCLLWLHCLNLLQNIPCKKAKLQVLQLPNYGLNCFRNHLWNCLGTIQLELPLQLFKDNHTTRIVSKIVQGWSYKRLWQISHILSSSKFLILGIIVYMSL